MSSARKQRRESRSNEDWRDTAIATAPLLRNVYASAVGLDKAVPYLGHCRLDVFRCSFKWWRASVAVVSGRARESVPLFHIKIAGFEQRVAVLARFG
jgi:hypothetical protein